MPLWDSVQRGLEKASQEASRLARTQRLRSTIDGLSRQMNMQSSNLVNKTMELFIGGQLSQSELLPFCQELASLKQQIDDALNELRQLQASQPAGPAGQLEGPSTYPPGMPSDPYYTPPPPMEGSYETVYAPPPPGYQPYPESASDVTPPPPPGVESLTAISAMSTVLVNVPTSPHEPPSGPQTEKRLCPACQAEVQPDHTFCQNCGTLVQEGSSQHSPTVRAGMPESAILSEDYTMHTEQSPDS